MKAYMVFRDGKPYQPFEGQFYFSSRENSLMVYSTHKSALRHVIADNTEVVEVDIRWDPSKVKIRGSKMTHHVFHLRDIVTCRYYTRDNVFQLGEVVQVGEYNGKVQVEWSDGRIEWHKPTDLKPTGKVVPLKESIL